VASGQVAKGKYRRVLIFSVLSAAEGCSKYYANAFDGKFLLDQVRKHGKSAPGGYGLGLTRYENPAKVCLFIIAKNRKLP